MRLVFLGPPGAGKGTQAEDVCRSFDLIHISTGDLLRSAVTNGSELGLKAKKYMEAGELVPDDMIVQLVADTLASEDKGFILDGFPRTIGQAQAMEKALNGSPKQIDLVIYFDTSEDVIIERLSGRRTCRKCGAIYHIKTMKPKVESVCDRCEGEVYQRVDDKLDTIKQRIKVYHQETDELIDYYKEKQILAEVPGDKTVTELSIILDDLLKHRV